MNADVDDKPKFDIDADELSYPSKTTDKNVSFLNLNVRDDRKNRKRDIEQKNQTEDEVVATVVEITTTESAADTTANPTSELAVDSTTETIATNAPTTSETITQTISTTTPSTTEATSSAATSGVDSGFQPILNFYYGGTPNENANFIYFTTAEPDLDLAPPTDNSNTPNDRNDLGEFKPSVQYEYRNYRYDTDSHFVPIVGNKQIF